MTMYVLQISIKIRLIDVEVVPVYWPEPQAPRLSALPLPTLTQAQFC